MSQLAREVAFGQTSAVVHPDEFTSVSIGSSLHGSRSRRLSHAAEPSEVESAALLLPAETRTAARQDILPSESTIFSKRVRLGIRASWVVNTLLLIVKAVAFILSGSYAVLASAVDSLVDILSQTVLAVAEYQAARYDHRFPIGRTRMAELSVLACACIMFVSTSLVIREALGSLWEGFHGHPPVLVVDELLFAVLGAATLLKLGLYIYCRALRKNPIMVALSEDHLNDVMSNVAAVGGAAVAGMMPRFWYADPTVALLFSLLIVRNWLLISWEQGQKMIGLEAPEELIKEAAEVTALHNPAMQLDRLTAYHHGSHIVVEVEVILPGDMTVRESHDIALELQHKIEAIESVERAFVHVDYTRRSLEEHKVERNLKLGERDVMKPLAGLESEQLLNRLTHQRSLGAAEGLPPVSLTPATAVEPGPTPLMASTSPQPPVLLTGHTARGSAAEEAPGAGGSGDAVAGPAGGGCLVRISGGSSALSSISSLSSAARRIPSGSSDIEAPDLVGGLA